MSAVAAVVALIATSLIPRPRRREGMPAAGRERAPRGADAREPAGARLMADALPRDVRRIAVVVVIGAIMSILDTTIVNVALETLRATSTRRWARSSGSRPATCWRSPP